MQGIGKVAQRIRRIVAWGGVLMMGGLSAADPITPVTAKDWLVTPIRQPARIVAQAETREIALENGLARRVFRIAPNFATVGLENLSTQTALLRGVKPEAILELDGHRYEIGGLKGQPDYAYLN